VHTFTSRFRGSTLGTGLFDGSHSDESIVEALPSEVGALLTPKFLGLLKHPGGHFLRLIRANSTCWTPPVPVRLYASAGDTTVTRVNALDCARAIRAHGGDVRIIPLGHVDHTNSDILSLPRILRWFTRIDAPGALGEPTSSKKVSF
jgi:hypothetical protein